ncbi:fluoride efflux transporter CrcB [Nocardioides sp. JQ2195]|uniref:fluoride efflux transporter CrcB n=1 Tax=Nocardioides sp. JQ2195 TaxID=2592334 RepID=UPI00143EAB91|nr:fluoride efflux transporter CrcB [Nocardioides sp. JQ2195]QIX25450.1 fluoride efflux transporter CrcB [Nocardioides sp. JQ2195]
MTRARLSATHVAAVALGGAFGAVLRWIVSQAVPHDGGFPWGTFAINVSGAFVLALLPAFAVVRRHPVLPLLLGPGVLGGFTTLSTFSEETRALAADGAAGLAVTYVLATLAAGAVAVVAASSLSDPAARDEFADEEGDE